MSSIADLLNSNGEFGRDPALSSSGGFVQGVVTDNGDKKFSRMVKVEYTAWKSGKNICQWIPLLHGYAGKEYGCYMVPEVGDIVLVGFIGPGMERPFVLGGLFPAGAEMISGSFTDKNETKRLKTAGGIDLILSDVKGKQTAIAVTPKGLTLSLTDEKETITLSDKGGENALILECKNGEVTLCAKSKITLKAGKCEITLDGKGGAVTIQCDKFEAQATRQAAVSANQQLTLSGGMLKVEGKQTAQLSGGTMTQIKGGMVKIN